MAEKTFTWPGQRKNDPSHRRVAEFLVMDIQHSPAWTQDLLNQITLVQSGSLEQWQRMGNCFCLDLSSEGAKITDLVDEKSPPETVALAEFNQAVMAWLAQVEKG